MKILLVEDEIQLGESIISYLNNEGYVCEWVKNIAKAEEKIHLYDYDCALIDISLPDGNGLEVIKELKKNRTDAGIIIISARDSLSDKIEGLDLGSDDYLTKPFYLAELNSRIKSVLRRRNFKGNSLVEIGHLSLNTDSQEVKINGILISFTKTEYLLLLFLLTNKNRVLTKESIAEHLWGDDADMIDSFDLIYSHIKNLRKKIGKSGGVDLIQSVYGIGYKLNLP